MIYEFPVNETVRTYLRIEPLFHRLVELMGREHANTTDHHHALVTLFDLLEFCNRSDLKNELLRDLDKHKQHLEAFRNHPQTSTVALVQILQQLEQCTEHLQQTPEKIGQALFDNPWLMAIRHRLEVVSGTCQFDLPAYFAWQHAPAEQRKRDLLAWASHILPLSGAVHWLLHLLRQSGHFETKIATKGRFEQMLSAQKTPPLQLVRVHVNAKLDLVPEINANRLVVMARFLAYSANDFHANVPPSTMAEDVSFKLALC